MSLFSKHCALPLQPACTAVAERTETLPAVAVEIPRGTSGEKGIAREKARFVADVIECGRVNKLAIKDAAPLTATLNTYPLLSEAGKKNLLAGSKAYANYRSWSRSLGKRPGSRAVDVSNWEALLPKYRGSRKYKRPGDERAWKIIVGMYEHPNQLQLKYVHKLASVAAAKAGITDMPSYDQVLYYYNNHVDQKSVVIARYGEDYFRNHVAGYIERDAPERDEAWVGDHHILDLAIRVWDEEHGRWRAERGPWLTAWLDWGSFFFVGWQMRSLSPNRDCIERSLRGALQRNNNQPPVCLYVDNGKDYKAKGFTRPAGKADMERANSIAEALGCRVIFSIPYNARAKIIERMFKEVCDKFSKWFASYRGSNPSKRPGEADKLWSHPELLPTLDEVAGAFDSWLAMVFHSSESNGKALKGKTPLQVRAETTPCRPPLEAAAVYKAFLRPLGERTILRGGCVNGPGRRYHSEALWALQLNTKVFVKVDTDNIDNAWIYTMDGREIGPATAKKSLPGIIPDDAPETTIEEHRSQMADQRRQVKEYKKLSAARRDMTHFLKQPTSPGRVAGMIAGPSQPERIPGATAPARPQPVAVANDISDLISELDDELRTQTAGRLAEAAPHRRAYVEPDDTDSFDDDFAAVEAEQAAAADLSDIPF